MSFKADQIIYQVSLWELSARIAKKANSHANSDSNLLFMDGRPFVTSAWHMGHRTRHKAGHSILGIPGHRVCSSQISLDSIN